MVNEGSARSRADAGAGTQGMALPAWLCRVAQGSGVLSLDMGTQPPKRCQRAGFGKKIPLSVSLILTEHPGTGAVSTTRSSSTCSLALLYLTLLGKVEKQDKAGGRGVLWGGIPSCCCCCCIWPVEVPEASLINWLPVSAAQQTVDQVSFCPCCDIIHL